jgi:hypothetical protein
MSCEKVITAFTLKWLDKYLERHAKAEDDVAEVLGKLVAALGDRLYLSVTLATDRLLAFKAYANINTAGKPLTAADVLRAYLVQDLGKDRVQLARPLLQW